MVWSTSRETKRKFTGPPNNWNPFERGTFSTVDSPPRKSWPFQEHGACTLMSLFAATCHVARVIIYGAALVVLLRHTCNEHKRKAARGARPVVVGPGRQGPWK
ncbi:hypothetical protein ACFX10_040239 [Malus domestica]